jgi:hypothetical protein
MKMLPNGAMELARRDDGVVLAVKDNGEFVTWWTPTDKPDDTYHGHYTFNIFDAIEDFRTR